jgi:hypothetical protein
MSLAHLICARLKKSVIERKVQIEERESERRRETERRRRMRLEREADPSLSNRQSERVSKMKIDEIIMSKNASILAPASISSFLTQNLGDPSLSIYVPESICFYVFYQGQYLLLKSNTTPMNVIYGLYDPGKHTSTSSPFSSSRSGQTSYPSVFLFYSLKK